MCDGINEVVFIKQEEIIIEDQDFKTINQDELVQEPEKMHRRNQSASVFNTQDALIDHNSQTHVTNSKLFCDVCGKEFVHPKRLKNHKVKHNNHNNIKCDLCEESFNNQRNLNKHKTSAHANENPFKCDLCPKRFSKTKLLKLHLKTHVDKKPFKCDLCPNAYKTQDYLMDHKSLAHENDGDFSCGLCGKKFSMLVKLKEHIDSHLTSDYVKCDQCNNGGDESDPYASGELFRCELDPCRKRYVSSTGEMQFECNLCLKKFQHKINLSRHFRVAHKGTLMVDDVKEEPVVIYDSHAKRVISDMKVEIEQEMNVDVKKEPEETDESCVE